MAIEPSSGLFSGLRVTFKRLGDFLVHNVGILGCVAGLDQIGCTSLRCRGSDHEPQAPRSAMQRREYLFAEGDIVIRLDLPVTVEQRLQVRRHDLACKRQGVQRRDIHQGAGDIGADAAVFIGREDHGQAFDIMSRHIEEIVAQCRHGALQRFHGEQQRPETEKPRRYLRADEQRMGIEQPDLERHALVETQNA